MGLTEGVRRLRRDRDGASTPAADVPGGLEVPLDRRWYAREAGRDFDSDEAAQSHYREVGRSRRLSPHPFVDPTTLDKARRDSPHPAWDVAAYVRRTPEAADHPLGPVGHLAERLSDDTVVDLTWPVDGRSVRWGGIATRWEGLAETWARQRRLALPAYVAELPEDHRLSERPAPAEGPDTLVSIVIPTWNRKERLQVALDSVRAQTWTHWEALVVDDGSIDGTPELVARLAEEDPRIRILPRPHAGVCAARNAGLAEVTGGLVAFLDSDNAWLPDYLEAMVTAFVHDDLRAAYGTLEAHTAGGSRYRATRAGRDSLLIANHVDMNVLMVRADLMAEVGGFDATLRRTVDYDLVLRLAAVTELVHVPVVGVIYDNAAEAGDRISVREAVAWSDHVQLRHRLDWDEIGGRPRDEGLLSVVVPVHERPALLLEQLATLIEQLEGSAFEVVVVDATKGRAVAGLLTAAYVLDERIRYERLPMRVSFGYAADVGFAVSRGSRVLFLAPGAVPEPGAVPLLARESGPHTVVQPVTVARDGTVLTAGAVFGPGSPLPAPLAAGHPWRGNGAPLQVPAADGQSLMVRAEDMEAVRGFDVLLDDELESTDLSLRLATLHPGARTLTVTGARFRAKERPWSTERSAASRAFFAERHADVRPTPDDVFAAAGLRPTAWRSTPEARHAFAAEVSPVER